MAAKDAWLSGARYAATGFEFAGIVIAGVFMGHKIDEYLGSEPWCMLLFTLGGFYGALRRLLWSLKRHS